MKWKDIVGYEGRYKISNKGHVKSLLNNIILADRYNTKGYLHVALYSENGRKDRMTHRLVALHFVKKVVGKPVVNHIDLNKLNNADDNLEWTTCPENTRHYFKNRNKEYYV